MVHILLLLNLLQTHQPLFTACVQLKVNRYKANTYELMSPSIDAEANILVLIIRFSDYPSRFRCACKHTDCSAYQFCCSDVGLQLCHTLLLQVYFYVIRI